MAIRICPLPVHELDMSITEGKRDSSIATLRFCCRTPNTRASSLRSSTWLASTDQPARGDPAAPQACVPQSGSADPTGQGKRLKLVPLSLDVQSLNDSVRPVPDRQRNAIRLPSGDQVPLSAPVLSRSSRRPGPSGWIVARVAFLGERELAGHESP